MVFAGGLGTVVLIVWALVVLYGLAAYVSTHVSLRLAHRAGIISSVPSFLQTTKAVAVGFAVYILGGLFTGGAGLLLFPVVNAIGLLLLRRHLWPGPPVTSSATRVLQISGLFVLQVILSVGIVYAAGYAVFFLNA